MISDAKEIIKKTPVNGAVLFLVRAAVLSVVGTLCAVTFWYCTSVYFDHNAALQDLFQCASRVLHSKDTVHWLDKGTLLGAKRNQRFVVWDGDVTLGALSNFTGSLYGVMKEVAEECNLHLTSHHEDWDGHEEFIAGLLPDASSLPSTKEMVWYLYDAQVGLKVMEWIPSPTGPSEATKSVTSAGTGAAVMASAAISAAFVTHGQKVMHSLDTFFPPRPCQIHAFQAFCPNNESAVLESHFGVNWLNETFMTLFN